MIPALSHVIPSCDPQPTLSTTPSKAPWLRCPRCRASHATIGNMYRLRTSPPPPPPRERTLRSGYRHVSSATIADRTHSLIPPPNRKCTVSEADVTDSGDEQGSLVEVRSWRGIDEDGQPATFVEERRRTRMIEQGSVGGSEFRPLTERLQQSRSWRDV